MQTLNVKTFPLSGRALIEASAGTGKTFTITALYNRLLIGHGRDQLATDQILVVTFTKAATEELRGRIRQRLRDSFSDLLRLQHGQSALDTDFALYLSEVAQAQGISAEQLRADLTQWVQANLALMDEASIYTIHGFCQRMLKQFAFDSSVMFNADLVLDSDSYLEQACADVWRHYAYELNSAQSRYLLSRFSGPAALMQKVRSRLNRPDMLILPALSTATFASAWESAKALFKQAQSLCAQTSVDDIVALIAQSGVNKRSYTKARTPEWVGNVFQYFNGEFSLAIDKSLGYLSAETLANKTDNGNVPQHALFTLVDEFSRAVQSLELYLDHAWQQDISERYFALLEQAGALTPNDLLRLLQAALQSQQGELLARQIRALYPVAMIDEFQDTDPQQYDIFSRIYPYQDASDHAFIMIGDPKQAIYAFRGADIFTYIRARRELNESQRFTLETNYRSHSQLVAGVNHVFAQHPKPFIFDSDIQFYPVNSIDKHDSQALRVNGVQHLPLQLVTDQHLHSRYEAQLLAARQCAEQIASALTNDSVLLGERRVEARDIAVLVRSHYQAERMRQALMAMGVGSVFLSRESVLKSQEAVDVFNWLKAVSHPADERALRSALASFTQGYNSTQLDQLLHSEALWEQELQRFIGYQQLWHKRGIMAALMAWLEHNNLAVQLRQYADGERRLTNLMHIGELLQGASRKLRGHEALLRWFGERVFSEDYSGEEAQLRLESDANLVSIVTIHKSKGLQYPLVYLPFLWDDTFAAKKGSDTIYFDEAKNRTVLHLDPDDAMQDEANKASLAESLRLLYVALTRAEQACFVWLLDADKGGNSKERKSRLPETALGYLLQLENTVDWADLQTRLTDKVQLGTIQWPAPLLNTGMQQPDILPQAQLFSGRAKEHWRVGSYSQLVADHGQDKSQENSNDEFALLRDDEHSVLQQPESVPEDFEFADIEFDAQHPALTFAKGPDAGTCLHAVFEHWDFVDQQRLPAIISEQLNHYGLLGNEQLAAQLSTWFNAMVQSPLATVNGERFCLADIQGQNRLDEMEFYLPVGHLSAAQIDKLLNSNKRFSFEPIQGYLKGFIDLIFCYNGRYYVADYKSNHLGFTVADYAPPALAQAMYEHAYDLQAWIYTLALDQLLRNRLPNYDAATHLGGVFYFFLRGMHLGAQAPLLAHPQLDLQLPPGVYYQTIDTTELMKWRTVFGLSQAHNLDSTGASA